MTGRAAKPADQEFAGYAESHKREDIKRRRDGGSVLALCLVKFVI